MNDLIINKFLSTVLKNANKCLNDYYSCCDYVNFQIEGKYEFYPNFDNERSIASFMTNYFCSVLRAELGESYQTNCINEFAIEMKRPIGKDEIDDLKKDYGLMYIKTQNRYLRFFYPDSLFNITRGSESLNVFVEYKITSKFILNKLAFDFLKYISYTSNSYSNSAFLYVSLYKSLKGERLPSNLGGCYEINGGSFLGELKNIDKSISFFVYREAKSPNVNPILFVKLDVLREMDETIEKITEYKLTENEVISVRNYSDDPFINSIDKFGENVISSERIKNNYFRILKIKESIIAIDSINRQNVSLSSECQIGFKHLSGDTKMSNAEKILFVDSIATYFNNHIKKIVGQIKRNDSVLNYSYKRSNWMLIIIAQFLKNIGIDGKKIDFTIEDFCTKPQDSEEVNNVLQNAYKNDNYKGNINSLALSLIYYITEVYPVIFDISDDKITVKRDYRAFKSKRTLIRLIHDFGKIEIGKKRLSMRAWDEIDIEKEMLSIASSIFNEYATHKIDR